MIKLSRRIAGWAAIALALQFLSFQATAGTLIINNDTSDPAPKKAWTELINDFKKANPDINVTWNVFDHEAYKSVINNQLSAEAPDIVSWYAGARMAPQVKGKLFADISDVWQASGLDKTMKSAKSVVTFDGKQYGIPYSTYQWGVYYRKDIFDKYGLKAPQNWAEMLAVAKKLKDNNVTPFAIGTKSSTWTTGGWFDYLDLRTNGFQFHMDLTGGKIPYTDARVRKVFEHWGELVKPGYFVKNHATVSWQESQAYFIKGEAAMYLMGNFLVESLKSAGLAEDKIGFFQFPEITKGIEMAEDAPTETIHMPSGAKNKAEARKFLAFVASPEVQSKVNITLGQLPINSAAKMGNDKFLQAGFAMLTRAAGLAQFYDRDAPAEMAKAGMDGFQEFMIKPENLDAILQRLEKVRQQVYAGM
ncbi:MAG: extracellular solute-binding protein [Candidatus Symbiobacter sp.]|nr:extracellular solute-binding protein [Candidatus Symbiobacter sp.]